MANHTELIKESKNSKGNTFDEVVDLYQHKVMNIAFGFLRNKEDAEDIAQDVFFQVYKSLSDLNDGNKVSSWISRIAVTRSLDFIRKKNRKKRFSSLFRVFNSSDDDPDVNRVELIKDEKGGSPEKKYSDRERSQILYQTIDALPEKQKIAFTLSKIEGLGNSEVAEVMEVSLSAVESMIHRAKKTLQSKLKHFYATHL